MALANGSAIEGTDDQIVNSKSKTANREFLRPGDLKKQSQFREGQMNVTSCYRGSYGDTAAADAEESKPKESQFQTGRLLIGRVCQKKC
jgi:hypothetical protein